MVPIRSHESSLSTTPRIVEIVEGQDTLCRVVVVHMIIIWWGGAAGLAVAG